MNLAQKTTKIKKTKPFHKTQKQQEANTDQEIRAQLKQQPFVEPNPLFSQRMRCFAEGLLNQPAQAQNKMASQSDRRKHRRHRAVVPAVLAALLLAALPLKSAAYDIYTSHLAALQQHPAVAIKNQKPEANTPSEGAIHSLPDTTAEVNRLSDTQAVAAAADYVNILYGVSKKQLQQMQTNVSWERSPLTEQTNYHICFASDSIRYQVSIDANGAFLDLSLEKEGFSYDQDNVALDKASLRKKGLEAKSIAERLLNGTSVITDAYIQYKLDENGRVPHGTAVCLFDLADGGRIRISYSMAEHTLWGAVRETGGAGQRDANVHENETRMFLELD